MTEHATAPKRTTTRAKRPHLRAVPDLPKLTAKQAKEHLAAEVEYEKAKLAFDKAAAAREKLRKRDRKKLPSGEDVVKGGVRVRRTFYRYSTFSLKDYRTAGNKVTPTMRKFIHPQSGENWTVTAVK